MYKISLNLITGRQSQATILHNYGFELYNVNQE